MQFSFATAQNILFGCGSLSQIAVHVARVGQRALLVTGRDAARTERLSRYLSAAGIDWIPYSVAREPEITHAVAGAERARRERCALVIGVGGGSVMDTAKAIAALATNAEPVETYIEVVGRGQPLVHAPLPCIAVPTTAGTGSEVTRNAVLKSARHQIKVSLRDSRMLPVLALVDPELTLSVPAAVTAATGCDALTQLLEAFVSAKANPMTDALCREALPRAARALPQAVMHGQDLQARSAMALASLFSGIALANAGLGAVHGIAGPLGGMIDAPHGAICARLLPCVVETNVTAIKRQAPDSVGLERFREVACMLTGSPTAVVADGIAWLYDLIARLNIPDLAHWGLVTEKIPDLVRKAQQASSMRGNPIALTDQELRDVIERGLGR
jgi:alcohol dehydrogenase class IV